MLALFTFPAATAWLASGGGVYAVRADAVLAGGCFALALLSCPVPSCLAFQLAHYLELAVLFFLPPSLFSLPSTPVFTFTALHTLSAIHARSPHLD